MELIIVLAAGLVAWTLGNTWIILYLSDQNASKWAIIEALHAENNLARAAIEALQAERNRRCPECGAIHEPGMNLLCNIGQVPPTPAARASAGE